MNAMNLEEIKQVLPHRHPFLLVDKVVDMVRDVSLTAVKMVKGDEFWCSGHFPNQPIMPGVLIVEALAQACGILAHFSVAEPDSLYVLAGLDNTRFKQIVEPDDELLLQVKLIKKRAQVAKFACEALVENKLVCSTDLLISAKRSS